MALSSLPLFHRVAGERVVVVGDGPMAAAKARLVQRAGGAICSEAEAHHAKLAFVALEDEKAAERACERLKRLGLLVNVADRPDLCDFTLPSVLERDPVLIAVGTGGASAGLAKHLRLRLERILPESLGKLAASLAEVRGKMRARFPDASTRRLALDKALGEGAALDPLDATKHDKVDAWLDEAERPSEERQETLNLSSPDPEDLTIRQSRWLGEADMLVLEGDIPQSILDRARADAERVAIEDYRSDDLTDGLVVILRLVSE